MASGTTVYRSLFYSNSADSGGTSSGYLTEPNNKTLKYLDIYQSILNAQNATDTTIDCVKFRPFSEITSSDGITELYKLLHNYQNLYSTWKVAAIPISITGNYGCVASQVNLGGGGLGTAFNNSSDGAYITYQTYAGSTHISHRNLYILGLPGGSSGTHTAPTNTKNLRFFFQSDGYYGDANMRLIYTDNTLNVYLGNPDSTAISRLGLYDIVIKKIKYFFKVYPGGNMNMYDTLKSVCTELAYSNALWTHAKTYGYEPAESPTYSYGQSHNTYNKYLTRSFRDFDKSEIDGYYAGINNGLSAGPAKTTTTSAAPAPMTTTAPPGPSFTWDNMYWAIDSGNTDRGLMCFEVDFSQSRIYTSSSSYTINNYIKLTPSSSINLWNMEKIIWAKIAWALGYVSTGTHAVTPNHVWSGATSTYWSAITPGILAESDTDTNINKSQTCLRFRLIDIDVEIEQPLQSWVTLTNPVVYEGSLSYKVQSMYNKVQRFSAGQITNLVNSQKINLSTQMPGATTDYSYITVTHGSRGGSIPTTIYRDNPAKNNIKLWNGAASYSTDYIYNGLFDVEIDSTGTIIPKFGAALSTDW